MENKPMLLTVYRVLAYVTGVWLLLLTFVAMPAKYLVGETARFSLGPAPEGMAAWFGDETILMTMIAVPHGYIYMVYVLVALWLALDRRWGVGKTLGVLLAGTIPFLGFVAERNVVRAERAKEAGAHSTSAVASSES